MSAKLFHITKTVEIANIFACERFVKWLAWRHHELESFRIMFEMQETYSAIYRFVVQHETNATTVAIQL